MMRSHGTPTINAGLHRSTSDFGGSLLLASTFPSISTTVSFASSDGCPKRMPPMTSQLFTPCAVPAPFPMKGSRTSSSVVNANSGTASHSIMRTDARLMAYAPMRPSVNQTAWFFQAFRMYPAIGISDCPAEYTMAMP